jgi:hypothetical protein
VAALGAGAQQTPSLGLGAALAGAILIGLAAWAYQKSKSGSGGGALTALVTAVVACCSRLLPVQLRDVRRCGGVAAGDDAGRPPTRTAGSPTMRRASKSSRPRASRCWSISPRAGA